MSPSSRTVLSVVLVVFAGIAADIFAIGVVDSDGGSSYLTAKQADEDPSPNQTVAFAEPSPAQQRVFEEAVGTEGNVAVPDRVGPDGVDR